MPVNEMKSHWLASERAFRQQVIQGWAFAKSWPRQSLMAALTLSLGLTLLMLGRATSTSVEHWLVAKAVDDLPAGRVLVTRRSWGQSLMTLTQGLASQTSKPLSAQQVVKLSDQKRVVKLEPLLHLTGGQVSYQGKSAQNLFVASGGTLAKSQQEAGQLLLAGQVLLTEKTAKTLVANPEDLLGETISLTLGVSDSQGQEQEIAMNLKVAGLLTNTGQQEGAYVSGDSLAQALETKQLPYLASSYLLYLQKGNRESRVAANIRTQGWSDLLVITPNNLARTAHYAGLGLGALVFSLTASVCLLLAVFLGLSWRRQAGETSRRTLLTSITILAVIAASLASLASFVIILAGRNTFSSLLTNAQLTLPIDLYLYTYLVALTLAYLIYRLAIRNLRKR